MSKRNVTAGTECRSILPDLFAQIIEKQFGFSFLFFFFAFILKCFPVFSDGLAERQHGQQFNTTAQLMHSAGHRGLCCGAS